MSSDSQNRQLLRGSISPHPSRSPSPTGQDTLTLRALVSTKDAGVIIGKGGKNVADLREQTGVKAGVSKVTPGVHERVLTISGPAERVADAYGLVVNQLLSGGQSPPPPGTPTNSSIRLLISHNLMGTVIGRSGNKIKSIQDASGARMVASKEMLPQSTERVVEVQGTADAITRAIKEIGTCLLEDWERGVGTVLFHPTADDRQSKRNSMSGARNGDHRKTNGDAGHRREDRDSPSSPVSPQTQQANLRTQTISIPSDMVGCIIGKNGTKITEIRRLSGSKISIAKEPHDETGERMFTIIGSPEANEKALYLLYHQLESEKERRLGREEAHEEEVPMEA
jgi:heterogeneous nuclear rnp K-like protein 2